MSALIKWATSIRRLLLIDLIEFRLLSQKLDELKDKIQSALVDRVVTDFVDISTPLKQFTDAVLAPEGKNSWNRNQPLKNVTGRFKLISLSNHRVRP